MMNFGDEEENPYILEFVIPKGQNEAPHLKSNKCKI